MIKKKILRIISSLDPSFGGPAKAIIDSTLELKSRGIDVEIVTNDCQNEIFYKKKNIKIHNVGSFFFTKNFNLKLFFWLLKNRYNYTDFLVHGIWELNTLIARLLLKKKYYVFLHGMLDPYFVNEPLKLIKKKIYWFLIEKQNLLKAKAVLLTSSNEKKLLSNTYVDTNRIKKKIINYGILKPNINFKKSKNVFLNKFKNLKDKNFFIFIGRFHKKKGCEKIIDLAKHFKNLKKNNIILMCGPKSSYKNYLKELSKRYLLNDYIHWTGFLNGDLKWGALSCAKAMLLPSHGENFGVSVTESLLCGTPVIITNKVNIYNYILNDNAGFISDDTSISFINAVDKFDRLKNRQIKTLNLNAKKCFDKNFNLKKQIFLY